jgi:hypothetical protein
VEQTSKEEDYKQKKEQLDEFIKEFKEGQVSSSGGSVDNSFEVKWSL